MHQVALTGVELAAQDYDRPIPNAIRNVNQV